MSVGPVAAGATPVELRADTRRTHKLSWPGGRLPALRALVDGSGTGTGAGGPTAPLRGVVQDSTGAVVATTAEVGVDADNQIGNPGAETASPSTFASLGSGVTLSRSTEQALDGAYSYKVVTDGSTGTQGMQGSVSYPVVAGEVLTISAWIYATTLNPINFDARWADAANNVTAQSLGSFTPTATGVWQQAIVQGVVPAGMVSARPRIRYLAATASTFYVDRIAQRAASQGVPRPLTLPFAAPPTLAAGDYFVSLHAGGLDRIARVYGTALQQGNRNLVANPSVEVDLSSIGSEGTQSPALARSTAWKSIGTASVRATKTATAAGSCVVTFGVPTSEPVVQGATYYGRAVVFCTTAKSVTLQLYGKRTDGTDVFLGDGGSIAVAANTATLLTCAVPVPFGTPATGRLRLRVSSSLANAEAIDLSVDAVMLSDTPIASYVDGDQPGCTLDGAAGASTSRGPAGTQNLVVIPNFTRQTTGVGGLAGWGQLNGTRAVSVDGRSVKVYRVTLNANGSGGLYAGPSGAALPVVGGTTYSGVAVISSLTSAAAVTARIEWKDANGTTLYSVGGGNSLNAPGRLNITATAPANAVLATLTFYLASTALAGDTYDLEGAAFGPGTFTTQFDGDSPGASWQGAAGSSGSVLWAGAEEIPDVYSDGASTAQPPGAAKTPGTMNLAMGQDVQSPTADFSTDGAMAGAGALRFPAGSTMTAESAMAGAGALRLPASSSMTADTAFAGKGTLAAKGGGTMTLESSLAGAGVLRFPLAPSAFAAESALAGAGVLRQALSAAFGADSALAGAGALRYALRGTQTAETGLTGAGTVAARLAADLSMGTEFAAKGQLVVSGGSIMRLESSLEGAGTLRFAVVAPDLAFGAELAGAGATRLALTGDFGTEVSMRGAGQRVIVGPMLTPSFASFTVEGGGTILRAVIPGGRVTRPEAGVASAHRPTTGSASTNRPRAGSATR